MNKKQCSKFMFDLGKSSRKTVLNKAEKIGGKSLRDRIDKDLRNLDIKIADTLNSGWTYPKKSEIF